MSRVALWAALLFACAGCAPPAPAVQGAPPAGGSTSARVDTLGARPVAASNDSGPSADAVAVLGTIPEPLRPEERVAPPAAPVDTTADTTSVVPVPSPTTPLGLEPPPAPDTSAAATAQSANAPAGVAPGSGATSTGAAAGAASAGAASAGAPKTGGSGTPASGATASGAPSKAVPDTCWRIQIGAPSTRAKANTLQSAGESQLLTPMETVSDRGLFKVRTRQCFDREAADRLRQRAVDSGFKGAFRFADKKR